jgi:hypothetical protein
MASPDLIKLYSATYQKQLNLTVSLDVIKPEVIRLYDVNIRILKTI